MRNPLTICGIRIHLRIPFANFADSTYICGFHLHFVDSTYISQNPLRVSESRKTSYFCLLRNPQQNKCAHQIHVTGIFTRIRSNFVSGIHLHFGTILKTCLWNPGTYRHKTVRLSSAQFDLVMLS